MTSHGGLPGDPEVSPAGSFFLSERDILQISATVSVCLFLQAPIGRMVGQLFSRYGGRKIKTLTAMLQPCIWGRLVMELCTLLAIIILTIQEAFHLNIRPFTRDTSLPPRTCLRLIYNVAIGRFLVVIGNILAAYDVNTHFSNHGNEIRSLTGHTGKPIFDIVYCVTRIVSNIISLGFGENRLLVLTSSVMELNCVHLAFRRLSELVTRRSRSKVSLKSTLFCSAIFAITRILLPVIFLGLAVSKESPLLMSKIPLTWFAFCCLFYAIFHSYLLHQWAQQLIQALSHTSSLPPSPSVQEWRNDFANNTSPFAIPYSSNFFTNDLRSNFDQVKTTVPEKSVQVQASDWQEKSFMEAKIGVHHGLLHCYDNRNLCSSRVTGESDKVNIGLKKATEKEKLFYWSDQALDGMDKIPDHKVLITEDNNKGETGSLLGYAGAGKPEESCEDDIADTGLSQCAVACEKTLLEGEDVRSSLHNDDGRMSPVVDKLFQSISLTMSGDRGDAEIEWNVVEME